MEKGEKRNGRLVLIVVLIVVFVITDKGYGECDGW